MAKILCDECGFDISDKAEACPHCGAPVNTGSSFKKYFLMVLASISIFSAVYLANVQDSESDKAGTNENKTNQVEKEKSNLGKYTAVDACQTFVKKKLTVPKSASYPWDSETAKIIDRDEKKIQYRSYVDSKNRMGVELRTRYLCTVKKVDENASGRIYKAGSSRWKLLELVILES